MKRRRVVSIAEDRHFWDYATQLCELQKSPHPDYSKRDWKQIGAGTIILVGVAIVGLAFWLGVAR